MYAHRQVAERRANRRVFGVSAPGKGDDQSTLRMTERIKELARDGYVNWAGASGWHLTLKGWAVLFAEAEPPMYPPKRKEKA